jgi:hypothetical protein
VATRRPGPPDIDPEVLRTRTALSVALRQLDPDRAAQAARDLVIAKKADLDRRFTTQMKASTR